MTIWLPRRRSSMNPLPSRIRQTSRPESLRSLANLQVEMCDVDLSMKSAADFRLAGRLKEELERLAGVLRRPFGRVALARDVELWAKRDVAVILALDDRRLVLH